MSETLKVFLKKVSLFSELSDAELDLLAQVATEVDYPRNSQIVREGDAGGSLLIVRAGEVGIVLERPTGEAVRISTFHPGDFFGEMSLFDRKPRSATATAVIDSRIIEISGDAFMSAIAKCPQMALRILAEIASRVRRTDETVRELADQVYREAHSAVQASVATELDSIKTIYQKTEERASQTLERAAQTVDHMDKLWSLMLRIIPVVGLALVVLTFFGVRSFNDVKAKVDDVNSWYKEIAAEEKEVQGIHDRMQASEKSLRIVKETMTDLRGIREAAGLGRRIETPDDLRRVAFNYEQARREVYQRYIAASESGARYENFEPPVVLEAVDTYITLGRGARSDGRLVIRPPEDRKELLDALVFILKNLPDSDEGAHEQTNWREDRRLLDLFRVVGEGAEDRQRKMTIETLKAAIGQSRRDRPRENMALILADFGEKDDTAIAILKKISEDKAPWRSARGSLALAQLGDDTGWRRLMRQLQEPTAAYPAAAILAQQDRGSLQALAGGQAGDVDPLIATIKNVIGDRINCPSASARCQAFNNCFEERYARWLVTCLDGNCETAATSDPVGGECRLGKPQVQ